MKKIIYVFLTFILTLAVITVLLFNGAFNTILKPIIENKINQSLPIRANLTYLNFGVNSFAFELTFSQNNTVVLEGSMNLYEGFIDSRYEIKFLNLKTLNQKYYKNLSGALISHGSVSGNKNDLNVKGLLAVASGGGEYAFKLKNFKVENIQTDFKNLEVEKLLAMFDLPAYINGSLQLKTDVTNLTNPKGKVQTFLNDSQINTALFEKKYDLQIPQSDFLSNLVIFFDKDINYDLLLHSNIINLNSKGTLKNASIKGFYDFDIKYLQAFEEILGVKLNGELRANGTIQGQKDNFDLSIVSSFADGLSRYNLKIKNLKPAAFEGHSRALNLKKVLYMFNKPRVAGGDLNINTDIKIDQQSYSGTNLLNIDHGTFNNDYFKNVHDKSFLNYNKFTLNIDSKFQNKDLVSTLNFDADIANLKFKKAIYSFEDKNFFSDYKLEINQLSKLKGLLKRDLKGSYDMQGDIIYDMGDKNPLKLTGKSDSLKGDMTINVAENILQIDAKKVSADKLFATVDMTDYFTGNVDGNLSYNFENKKGVLKSDFKDAKFTPNFFTHAIKSYSKVDLTTYDLDTAELNSVIDTGIITSDFNVKAGSVYLASDAIVINNNTNIIKGNINFKPKENIYIIKVKGSMDNLEDAFDYENLLAQEVQRQIEKKAKEFIEKELGEEFLKGLFN